MKHFIYVAALSLSLLLTAFQSKHPSVSTLLVDMKENPVGIATEKPRFSWQIASDQANLVQTAYRIQVARTEKDLVKETHLVWDTRQVKSNQSMLVPYEGNRLVLGDSIIGVFRLRRIRALRMEPGAALDYGFTA
jgi:alpha-L-rhamnosidase